ncbi:MAG TPA: HDOD domain-containing protein [Burkholderiales bacterium]|nr:HDOD domain-containing protein [Burkholderiales bacterium]
MEATQKVTVQHLRQRIDDLPLLPNVVVELLRLDSRAEDYFERVLSLASGDPTFATKLLLYANSASVAASHPVTSLRDALVLVGAQNAVDLILAHSCAWVFLPHHDWERDLWSHSLAVASLMRALASHLRGSQVSPDKAHLFGLLHDIGRFVLYLEAPEELRTIGETEWNSPQALVDAELGLCGFTHAELGYLALEKWKLPAELAWVVRYHHSAPPPGARIPVEDRQIIDLLRDADGLACTLARPEDWRGLSDSGLQAKIRPVLAAAYDAPPERLSAVIRDALERAAQMGKALGVARPGA